MSKYYAKKTWCYGVLFDSKKEAARYQELYLAARAKRITNLELQKEYVLIPAQYVDGKCVERAVKYKADFVYQENGQTVVEDTKGVKTKDYIIKRKLMLLVHGIRIREV